jgi:hypothetical protein
MYPVGAVDADMPTGFCAGRTDGAMSNIKAGNRKNFIGLLTWVRCISDLSGGLFLRNFILDFANKKADHLIEWNMLRARFADLADSRRTA